MTGRDHLDEDAVEDVGMPSGPPGRVDWPKADFLWQQDKESLIQLIGQLAAEYPEVRKDLQARDDLSKGKGARLVNAARVEMRLLTAQPAWRHSWNNEGEIPDYSGLRRSLQQLLVAGHAEEVLSLGKELLHLGEQQVENSHDEGEAQTEIASCMDVAFQALARSSLTLDQQVMWAIEVELRDSYDLCHGVSAFWGAERSREEWDTIAERLVQLFEERRAEQKNDGTDYRRGMLFRRTVAALKGAARDADLVSFCQREATEEDAYPDLVRVLGDLGRRQDAREWALKGIAATGQRHPRLVGELLTLLRQEREQAGDWPVVAAFRADDFFRSPSPKSFQALAEAATSAGHWDAVREAAIGYLEAGRLPSEDGAAPWPLPDTGLRDTMQSQAPQPPMTAALIDIAITETRPDDVLRWYDYRRANPTRTQWPQYVPHEAVAKAVQETHPERAIGIWRELAEDCVATTRPSAYATAVRHLQQVKELMLKTGCEGEWRQYLFQLRLANSRKSRLMKDLKVLDP